MHPLRFSIRDGMTVDQIEDSTGKNGWRPEGAYPMPLHLFIERVW